MFALYNCTSKQRLFAEIVKSDKHLNQTLLDTKSIGVLHVHVLNWLSKILTQDHPHILIHVNA